MAGDTRQPYRPTPAGRNPEPIESSERQADKLLVKRPKLADQVYELILWRIIEGRHSVGSRLPSESILAGSFEVSRPIVREALARLRADGIVVSRRGSGTYVRRPPSNEFARFAPPGDVADVMRCYQLRAGIEPEAARHAARFRSRAELSAVRRALKALEKAVDAGELGADADRNFHYAVAVASGNALFPAALQLVDAQMRVGIRLARRLALLDDNKRLTLVQVEHSRVYEAILRNDEDGAAAAMRKHIENSHARLIGEGIS